MSEELQTPEQEKPVEKKKLFTLTICVYENNTDVTLQCEPGNTAGPLQILGALEIAKTSQYEVLKFTDKRDQA